MSAGYVYALLNPAMPDLIKVGRTTKEPEERAKELSSVTGVATSFIVGYKRFFSNCVVAEEQAHLALECKGFRVSANREFFEVPLNVVVSIISQLDNSDANGLTVPSYPEETDIAQTLYEEAQGYEIGHGINGITFSNPEKCLALMNKAAKLGHSEANEWLGDYYWDGFATSRNEILALSFYDKAMTYKSPGCCFSIFLKLNSSAKILLATDCWRKFYRVFNEHKTNILNDESLAITYQVILQCFKKYFEGEGADKYPSASIEVNTLLTKFENEIKTLSANKKLANDLNVNTSQKLEDLPDNATPDQILVRGILHLTDFDYLDLSKGIHYLKQAAALNCKQADIFLGQCYLSGAGVDLDLHLAKMHFDKAVTEKIPEAFSIAFRSFMSADHKQYAMQYWRQFVMLLTENFPVASVSAAYEGEPFSDALAEFIKTFEEYNMPDSEVYSLGAEESVRDFLNTISASVAKALEVNS